MRKGKYWHPGYGEPLSIDEIRNGDKDFQKEVMEEWFLSNYEDPVENTPYATAEGGYMYIWGGPYSAYDVLQNEFSGVIPDEIISELAQKLEDREGCYEWSGKPGAEEFDDYLFDAIVSNTKYHDTFLQSINNIKVLLTKDVDGFLKRNFYMLLYVNVITALETYLSDAFINDVMGDTGLFRRFVETNPDFSNKKISMKEIFSRMDNIKSEVKSYLLDLIWHNLEKVRPMYRTTLCVDFPPDIKDIFKGIVKRHDIVHRNGKTKDNKERQIEKEDVHELIEKVCGFVEFIDEQLTNRKI